MKIINEECCGCGACYNSCPVNAISILQDKEGFLYPIVDESICTNCGLCKKVCNHSGERSTVIEAFAGLANDDVRKVSSSGGVFFLLAKKILSDGGYVCGAAFSSDFKSVNHIVISSVDELPKLQSSKYLQSDTKNVYKEVKDLLNSNKVVLFSGTPCQVGGLNKFLQKKYDNLITVDVLCHGVPSPLVWKKYVEEISQGKKIIDVTFRNKKQGWVPNILIRLDGNDVFEEQSIENLYYKSFLSNLCLRKSCSTCNYANLNRPSDITLGDFWGIDKYDKKMNDKKGTSFILINTAKGQKNFQSISSSLKKYKKAPVEKIVEGNPNLKQPSKAHLNRKRFFENLNDMNILENIKNNLEVHYDGVIVNLWHSPNNFGAVLTAYSIQQYFLDRGKEYYILNYAYTNKNQKTKECENLRFAKKYLLLTQKFSNVSDLHILNSQTDNFVVGSDQVFRYIYSKINLDLYLLKFTEFSKRRVAFSASYGISGYEADQNETYKTKKALKRFDYISVRESSGVDVSKKIFDVDSEHIIDPVFLVDKEKFDKFIETNSIQYNNKIICYILDRNSKIDEEIDEFAKKVNLQVEFLSGENYSVGQWLAAIKNCKYFITDSFHGSCFSLIYHKPFICLKNISRGAERFVSLEKTFGIKSNFISSIDELKNFEILEKEIDWDNFEKIISEEKQKVELWFNKAFNSPKQISQEKISAELDFINDFKNYNQNIEKESFLSQVFSVKNSKDKKRKIITILGIRIKIKRKNK